MKVIVDIRPYGRAILTMLDSNIEDMVGGHWLSKADRFNHTQAMMNVLVKVTVADYMSNINSIASESIYCYLLNRGGASMLNISHTVCEVTDSAEFLQMRRDINDAVSGTSAVHLGVNDVEVCKSFHKVMIDVAERNNE